MSPIESQHNVLVLPQIFSIFVVASKYPLNNIVNFLYNKSPYISISTWTLLLAELYFKGRIRST